MNYSLHIGLNRVNPAVYGGWSGELSGCHNDADAMAEIAIDRGAQSYMLLSSDATIRAVIDGIYVLSIDSKPGDTVLITYSGHGGQVPDRNNDEKDGFDETWVLYDGMLLDDDLNTLLAGFKRGVKVIVVSDSCHSGTVTKARVMEENANLIGVKRKAKAAPKYACRVAPVSSPFFQFPTKIRMKASVILLSGCMDNQFSYDGTDNGLFTYTMLTVWAGGKFTGSYREFRKQIGRLMPPEQTPQIYIIGGKNKAFEAGPVFL